MGRVRLVAVAALVAALTAGCGDAPTPRFAPPSSSAPTAPTTAAADPLPPEMPELAKKHTVAGAKAFVKYYWAVANYAQANLDPAALDPLADPDCAACRSGRDGIATIARWGGRIVGGATSVAHLDAQPFQTADGTWISVGFDMSAGPERIVYPGTRPNRHFSGGKNVGRIVLAPTRGGWVIDLLELQS